MDWQWLVNGLFATVGILLGALYATVRGEIKKQDELLEALAGKVQSIEVLVAGNYVHKDDLERITNALFRKLDQICDKLDRKADK